MLGAFIKKTQSRLVAAEDAEMGGYANVPRAGLWPTAPP